MGGVGYSGNILANWKTSATNAYTVPIGMSVSKVLKLGPLPVRFALAGQWMPVHATNFGQAWNLQLTIAPVLPKLIRGNLLDPESLQFGWGSDLVSGARIQMEDWVQEFVTNRASAQKGTLHEAKSSCVPRRARRLRADLRKLDVSDFGSPAATRTSLGLRVCGLSRRGAARSRVGRGS